MIHIVKMEEVRRCSVMARYQRKQLRTRLMERMLEEIYSQTLLILLISVLMKLRPYRSKLLAGGGASTTCDSQLARKVGGIWRSSITDTTRQQSSRYHDRQIWKWAGESKSREDNDRSTSEAQTLGWGQQQDQQRRERRSKKIRRRRNR